MNMTQAIQSGFKNYFNFEGRASRSEFWWFYLSFILFLIASFAIIFAGAAIEGPNHVEGQFPLVSGIGAIVLALGFLAYFIPLWAMRFRRLHDANHTAVWLLIAFVPFGGIVLLVFFCQAGLPFDNKYGPSPLKLGRGRSTWTSDPVA